MNIPDPFPNDPFFKRGQDGNWNACIGSQGDEHNYVTGYMEAATVLVNALLDGDMYGKRDTLALPILYNARHAIELVLKFSLRRLIEAGVIQGQVQPTHMIRALWDVLDQAHVGDSTILRCIAGLKPFIDSMTAIDHDGQELRYHLNNSDDPSMAGYSIANLEVIRDSLAQLAELVKELADRTLDFVRERETGTFTNRSSRRDLFEIVKMLPPLANWKSAVFDEAKVKIRADFSLSSNEFCRALNVIKAHREMRALLGAETDFAYLTDDLVISSMKQWRRWHPPRAPSGSGMINSKELTAEILTQDRGERASVVHNIEKMLSPEQFGELAAIFFQSRNRTFTEYFDNRMASETKAYLAHKPSVRIVYLFDKTNLLKDVTRGAAQIGRLTLSETLKSL